MIRVFLDANILIDLVEKRGQITSRDLSTYQVYISPLTVYVLMYVTKRKIPYPKLEKISNQFIQVAFDKVIVMKALQGPTVDFEDNVQLQSAAEAECDLFLTNDQKLLDLKFFGKAQISSQVNI